MFDVSWSEMLLIVVVAVVAIGPKDLPHALHSAGKLIRKMKLITSDIQKSLEKVMLEGELDEITRAANRAGGDNVQMMVERQLQKERAQKEGAAPSSHAQAAPVTVQEGDEELRYDLDDEEGDADDYLNADDGRDDMDAEEFIPRGTAHVLDKKHDSK